MFDLKTASKAIRTVAASYGIKSGKYEPMFTGNTIAPNSEGEVVAKVFNRNHPEGIEITRGDVEYAERYLI